MANENITPVELTEIQLFENGERANADNLNRPVIQLRDNQIEQNRMLDEIYTVLGADDVDLDELQEVINKLKEFQETLASDDEDFDSLQEILNQVKKHKEELENGLMKTSTETGDGSKTEFDVSFYKDSIIVFIEGIKVSKDKYTLNYDADNANKGISVTFDTAPENDDEIDFVITGTGLLA